MLLFQQTFLPLVSFIFAVMVLFAAIYQTCLLLFGTRPMRLSPWFFIVPMLLLVAASYIFLKRGDINTTDQHIMLISGCAFTLFGIVSIVEGIIIAHGNRRIDKAAQAKPEPAHTPDYNIEKIPPHPICQQKQNNRNPAHRRASGRITSDKRRRHRQHK